VLFENRDAVTSALVALEKRLESLRIALADDSRDILEESLATASVARRRLPGRALSSENLSYLRVSVADNRACSRGDARRFELLVNIYDIEIAHGIEGVGGTLLLAVDSAQVATFCEALNGLVSWWCKNDERRARNKRCVSAAGSRSSAGRQEYVASSFDDFGDGERGERDRRTLTRPRRGFDRGDHATTGSRGLDAGIGGPRARSRGRSSRVW